MAIFPVLSKFFPVLIDLVLWRIDELRSLWFLFALLFADVAEVVLLYVVLVQLVLVVKFISGAEDALGVADFLMVRKVSVLKELLLEE